MTDKGCYSWIWGTTTTMISVRVPLRLVLRKSLPRSGMSPSSGILVIVLRSLSLIRPAITNGSQSATRTVVAIWRVLVRGDGQGTFQRVAEVLFGDQNPVGQTIRIKNVPFTVIGVLAEKGQSAQGQDQDDTIMIPVTTAQKKLFGTQFPGMVRIIMVKAKSAEDLSAAEKQMNELLRQRHHLGQKQDNDFTVRNLTQIMQAAEQSTKVMTLLLGAIASVSLLVGGIGIMNIMLVSVTERTREIGIRMAIGAKTWDIRLQFIIEALTLSLIGGIIGIIVGVSTAMILSSVSGWPTVVSFLSVMLAFSFSGFIGIFFGFYPAYKASLLNPIDALRYE